MGVTGFGRLKSIKARQCCPGGLVRVGPSGDGLSMGMEGEEVDQAGLSLRLLMSP